MFASKHDTEAAIDAFLRGTDTGNGHLDKLLRGIRSVPARPAPDDALISRVSAEAGAGADVHRRRSGRSAVLPPRWRRRAVLSTLGSSIIGKIAVAGVALATTTGGLAAADALPDPAQQIVSDVAARIGISLPAPDEQTPEATDDDAEGGPSDAPDLPEQASDTAKRVIEIVFGGDPQAEGSEFGRRVAETASDGRSGGNDHPGPPDGVPGGPPDGVPGGGPPDKIPAGPPSTGGGTPASPSSPRP